MGPPQEPPSVQLPPLVPASLIPRKSGYFLIPVAVSADFSCMVRHVITFSVGKKLSVVVAVVALLGKKI